MDIKRKAYKRLIKYFLLALFLFYSIFLLLFLYKEQIQRNNKLIELQNTEKNMMITYSKVIAKEIGNINSDLKFLQQTYSSNSEDRMLVENHWFLFCKNKYIYDQIRFIDKFGREKIKVTYNYGSNESRCIDDLYLQDKSNKSYVKETLKLDKDKIYISHLDLSKAYGVPEEPIKPIIRFSTPIYDASGNLEGMLVVNYLASNIIREFKDMSKFSNGQAYLVNKEGYFLYSNKKEEEWGFMYKDRQDKGFMNKYKEEWKLIKAGENEILSNNGLFISTRINLEEIFKYDQKHILRDKTIISKNDWIVMSFIDRYGKFTHVFEKDLLTRIKKISGDNIIYLISIAFMAILVSLLAFITQNSYLKTKFLSETDSMTGTLNRRSGFDKLKRDIEIHKKNGNNICICYTDVDGLKHVNDILGHNVGDELILTSIDIIKNTIRGSDYIIRTGGDEFLIVFSNANEIQAENVWNRIQLKFENINIEENREYVLNVSHGIVEIPREKDLSIEELVSMADEKMYIQKRLKDNKKHIIKRKICYNEKNNPL